MRKRSYWAWGWEDRLATDDGLKTFGRLVGAMLGFKTSAPIPATPDTRWQLPAPRVEPPEALAQCFELGPEARALRTHGRGYVDLIAGFRGDFRTAPDLVALPRDASEVAQLLEWAASQELAVIPFGGGTSVVGGVTLSQERWGSQPGVMALDLGRMDRVTEVDPDGLSARIQGGATGPRFNEQLAEHDLVLRHYPQSYEFATLGGMIATRSGGHFATVYTHIDELVSGLSCETPVGSVEIPRLPGGGAGPDPRRWWMGSEGTLGVITEAWLRVRRRPIWRSKATVLFTSFADAVRASRLLAQSQLSPSNCRVLDPTEAALHRVTPARGDAVLLIGFESASHPTAPLLDLALDIVSSCGGRLAAPPSHRETAPGQAEARADAKGGAAASWRNAFIEMPYLQSNLVRLGVLADTFETACTWDRFDAMHAELIRQVRAVMKRGASEPRCMMSCRFTHVYPDGPAPYYTFITPARVGDEVAQWRDIKAVASEILVKHGATITHHHAVGRTHQPWAHQQRPRLMTSALEAVKETLDPTGVLNPGVLGLGL